MSLAQSGLMDPSQLLNTLAMLLAIAGSWLLLATRWREWLASVRVPVEGEGLQGAAQLAESRATARLNQLFYRVGYAGLGLALAVSWFSRLI